MDDPPETKRESSTYTLHGEPVSDPYLWLETDDADRDEWVDRQNEHARAYLEAVPARSGLEPTFERHARTAEYGSIVPRPTGYFQEVEAAEDDQPVLYHRPTLDEERTPLVDPNAWSDDATSSMGWWSVAPAGDRLAYAVDEGGEEQFDVRIASVPEGTVVETIPSVGRGGPPAWTDDGLYYTVTGEASEGAQLEKAVRYHPFDSPTTDDATVMTVDDPGTWPGLWSDPTGPHVVIARIIGWERSELHHLRAGETDPRPLVVDTDAMYMPGLYRGRLYVRTDMDAPRYRLLATELGGEPDRIDPGDLAEVLPERDGVLQGVTFAADHLLARYEEAAVSSVEVFDLDGTPRTSVGLPGLGTVGGLHGNRDAPEAFYAYQSFERPPRIVRYDPTQGSTAVLDEVDIDPGVDLTVGQRWFTSPDGTSVPTFVVHRTDVDLDGANPAVLTGYGGFEVSQTPAFPTFGIEFIRDGGVWSVANLRGGGEFGKPWHRAARHGGKQRTFDDMIAVAEGLVEEGYTGHDRLGLMGGSNGGLTVGAVMTQRPELARAVVCRVPLLDMLRFDRFLLGASWTTEYGSPDDPEAYGWLRSYSPYHNLEERAYPSVLFTTAEGDTRVHPVHAWKMAARMQRLQTADLPVLVKTARETGHGTGKPTWMVVEEALDVWSFLYRELGVTKG